jgi:hypothetical protein
VLLTSLLLISYIIQVTTIRPPYSDI